MGIVGNENADLSAKIAATGVDGKVSTREILNTDIMGIIKATVRKKMVITRTSEKQINRNKTRS